MPNDPDMLKPSEEELVAKARKGDLEAFSGIVRLHQQWVRAYFRSRLSDWSVADDLSQDVFISAHRKISQFSGESSLQTWLGGIAHNHLRNFIRKHRELALGGSEELQPLLDQQQLEQSANPDTSDQLEVLRSCVAKLPENSRSLINQRYTQGLNLRDIAKESGRGYSALTMQFHRVREALAECIQLELQRSES